MTIYKIIIFLLATALLMFMYSKFIASEVNRDNFDINANGSKNNLLKTWHRQSFLKVVGISLVLCIPYLYFGWKVFLSLLLLEGAIFWKFFDIGLNRARGLADNYVGQTSSIDRWFRSYFTYDPHSAMGRAKNILIIVSAFCLIASFF